MYPCLPLAIQISAYLNKSFRNVNTNHILVSTEEHRNKSSTTDIGRLQSASNVCLQLELELHTHPLN